jgi:hypothetical protein
MLRGATRGKGVFYEGLMEEKKVHLINTGLPGFVLLDEITQAGEKVITGIRRFSGASPCLGMESLAQLGAFHIRFLTGFQKHAFLVKINRCFIRRLQTLQGKYLLQGVLVSRSSTAYSYELQAGKGKNLAIEGNFLYAAVDYDDVFRKEKLQEHYQRLFACLQSVTERGSSAGAKPGC